MTNGSNHPPDYDIAISFLAADEALALELANRLVGLNVFVYSKAQERIAATDGLDTFGQTFRDGSRIQHGDRVRPGGLLEECGPGSASAREGGMGATDYW